MSDGFSSGEEYEYDFGGGLSSLHDFDEEFRCLEVDQSHLGEALQRAQTRARKQSKRVSRYEKQLENGLRSALTRLQSIRKERNSEGSDGGRLRSAWFGSAPKPMDARLKEEEYKFRAVAEFAVPLILVKYTKEGESKGPHQSTSGDGAEEMQQSGAVNQSNDRSSQPLTESIIEDVPKSLFDVNDLEDSYATVEHPVVDPEELDRMIGFVGGIDHNSPGGVSGGSHNRRTSRSMSASGLGVSVLSNTAQSELYAYLLRLKQEVENGTRPLDADTKEVPVQRFSADAADVEEDNSQDHDNLHLMASSTLTFNTSKLESDEEDKEEENQRAPADDTLPQTMTGSALSTTWQPVLSYSELLEGISMLFVALRKSQTKCRHLKDRYHSKSVELRALQLGSGASSSLVEAFETAKLREANEKIAILQTELSRTCTRASSLEHALKAKTAWYNAMWFPQDFGGLFPRSAWIALAHVLLGGSVLFTNWWRRLFGVLFGRKAPPRIPRPSQTWRVRAVFVV